MERRGILHRSVRSKVRPLFAWHDKLSDNMAMRRFERELEALRKELAEAQSKSQRSSPILDPSETESEPVSPLITSKPLGGDESEVSAIVDAGLSLRLEGRKDR